MFRACSVITRRVCARHCPRPKHPLVDDLAGTLVRVLLHVPIDPQRHGRVVVPEVDRTDIRPTASRCSPAEGGLATPLLPLASPRCQAWQLGDTRRHDGE
jgi:hypothetical protein